MSVIGPRPGLWNQDSPWLYLDNYLNIMPWLLFESKSYCYADY